MRCLQSHLDGEDAKAGFVHSSARSANIVQAVQKLRHYPRRFPQTDPPCVGGHALRWASTHLKNDDRLPRLQLIAKSSLATKISIAWAKLSEPDQHSLTAFKAAQPGARSADLVEALRR